MQPVVIIFSIRLHQLFWCTYLIPFKMLYGYGVTFLSNLLALHVLCWFLVLASHYCNVFCYYIIYYILYLPVECCHLFVFVSTCIFFHPVSVIIFWSCLYHYVLCFYTSYITMCYISHHWIVPTLVQHAP